MNLTYFANFFILSLILVGTVSFGQNSHLRLNTEEIVRDAKVLSYDLYNIATKEDGSVDSVLLERLFFDLNGNLTLVTSDEEIAEKYMYDSLNRIQKRETKVDYTNYYYKNHQFIKKESYWNSGILYSSYKNTFGDTLVSEHAVYNVAWDDSIKTIHYYDSRYRLMTLIDAKTGRKTDHTYDDEDNLLSVKISNTNGMTPYTELYTYENSRLVQIRMYRMGGELNYAYNLFYNQEGLVQRVFTYYSQSALEANQGTETVFVYHYR